MKHAPQLLSLALATLLVCTAAPLRADTWMLSMEDADVVDVATEVAGILGLTAIVDPRAKARLTVHSDQALDRNQVRELFYTVLESRGLAAVEEDGRLLVVPAADAKARAASRTDLGVVTQVLALHSAQAADLAALLKPLASAQGYVGPSASANALVITDTAANARRLARLAQELDNGEQAGHDVLPLKHADANELATLLERATARKGDETPRIIADPAGHALVLLGPPALRERLKGLALSLDVPRSSDSNAAVIHLRHGDARQLAEVLDPLSQQAGEPLEGLPRDRAGAGQSATVRADESQNALVMIGPSKAIRTMQALVSQLDQPRAQVMIEAAIVEISGDTSQALGVQWGLQGGDLGGSSSFPGAGISPIGTLAEELDLPDGGLLRLGNDRFRLLVSALASNVNSNLLSTPSLMTLDNQEAEILVGQNVPFLTGSYTTGNSGSDNPFTTVERRDVGIKLKIRPHINDGDAMRLEIEQENSEVAPTTDPAVKDLITNKRSVKSTILARDGQIIVLGGLIKDSVRQTESGVPGLKRLPWVGRLFTWRRDTQVKTNLMVFLRPTVMREAVAQTALAERQLQRARQTETEVIDDPRGRRVPPEAQGLFEEAPGSHD
ncbi:type II secretion system secretin GspD [Pseudomonas sp. Marseille-Q5115]|uniref:type II secretion system secretin GspD n=1 Tax=Pseudomonas sp. Marseille-Q5115 TaxID=2866593 RepID=UPI001CE43D01|nr:type II secretion system secretin GspD [Pseudomonas sp. Marseille-Q5115]